MIPFSKLSPAQVNRFIMAGLREEYSYARALNNSSSGDLLSTPLERELKRSRNVN